MTITAGELEAHVTALAGRIGERNIYRPQALEAAARYISGQWQQQGQRVRAQRYDLRGVECANLQTGHPPGAAPGPILLLGAHYDTVSGSPGADDNASGVAALLALSRRLAAQPPACCVRLVAFVNEEPPFFWSPQMGSMRYARRAREAGEDIRLMISLEMLGCFSDAPASQHYPPLLRHFYPQQGNFIALVSNLRWRGALRRCVAAFRQGSDFPLEHLAAPALVPGVSWSDHQSFWRHGYPALMLTDTAFYRNARYHGPADTPDTLDYEAMARLCEGVHAMVQRLAREEAPLRARMALWQRGPSVAGAGNGTSTGTVAML